MPNPKNKFWQMKRVKNQVDNSISLDLLMYGVIGEDEYWDDVTSKEFANELKDNDDAQTINLRINSPGGDVFAGKAIYAMLKRHNAYINAYIDGLAASIASLIAMAADNIIMPKGSMMMVHKPWTGPLFGNSDAMRKEADTLDKIEETMILAYQDKTGLSADEIKNIMRAETWLSASDAVEMGFADIIEDSNISACIKQDILSINGQNIDLSKYKNFDKTWFDKKTREKEGLKHGVEGNQNKPDSTLEIKKNNERKNSMDLTELCKKFGFEYSALAANGMSDEQIKNLILGQIKTSEPDNDHKAEKQRSADILNLGKQYNAQDIAVQYVQEGKTFAEFKDELLKIQNNQGNSPINAKRTVEGVGLNEEEARRFSFVKLINAMADPTDRTAQKAAEFEFDACAAAAEKYGVKNKGMVIPIEALVTPLMPKKAAGTIDTGVGSSLIQTELLMSSFIELLRNKCVILQRARQLTGLVGNIDIPRQNGGSQGYWLGEDTEAAGSNPTFDEIPLSLKTVGGNAYITRKMRKQTTLDVEGFTREDIATGLALALDYAAFYGSGSANQPCGLKNITGINAVKFAGTNPTYSELVLMETEIAADNAAVDYMSYIFNSRMKGYCKSTQKFPNDASTGGTIWEPGNSVNGYENTPITNQVTNGDVFFGNFADFILGMWGGLEILVDPYTYSKKGGTLITAFQDVDMVARHAASFCYGSSSATPSN